MAKNVSDANGRALEFKITDTIIENLGADVVGTTDADQIRDKAKYDALEAELQKRFEKAADRISAWLEKQFDGLEGEYTVERLPDSAAVQGDVTDIKVSRSGQNINLSIKHNHHALKHQRPPSTAQHCGYPKYSEQDVEFRERLDEILERFLSNAKKLKAEAEKFNELKVIDGNFINSELYDPVCHHVADSINALCQTPDKVLSLFNFIVGNDDYTKVIVSANSIQLFKFSDLADPDSVVATVSSPNYVALDFSNGWKINLRLHTASSRLGKSLKFDSQANISDFIPVETIG